MSDAASQRQRIDKWLWHARFVKTRSLAQKLIKNGSVRVNAEKITSPSKMVQTGDVLTLALPGAVKIIEITDFSERRGPYSQAILLYNDLTPIPENSTKEPAAQMAIIETSGRPTKHQRKKLLALKHNFNE